MPDSAAVPQEFISPRDLITKALDSLRPNSSPAPGPRLVLAPREFAMGADCTNVVASIVCAMVSRN